MSNSMQTEQHIQEAWEKALRGDIVTDDALDEHNQETASVLRSMVIWQQLSEEKQPINELERERQWKRLSADILPKEKPTPKSLPKWWMGVAASVMLGVLLVPIWQSHNNDNAPEGYLERSLNGSSRGLDETAWIEKGHGMVIFEAKPVASPQAYADSLRQALLTAGFQISPLEQDGDGILLRLRVVGDITPAMQVLLDEHDLLLNRSNEVNIRIEPK